MTKIEKPNSYRNGPDERGHFGIFGGRFVAETLMPLILSLETAYEEAKNDPAFHEELGHFATHYVGRPSPLYFAERMTQHLGGAKIYFKRDELNHTGAHKINNVMGQILLARRMGKPRIIAETGAGQHGVATATACARFGLQMRGLHGRGRRRAAEAQRVPHEDARRRGRAGAVRRAHAQRRDERGAARLGHQCRRHVLLHRHRGRAASLSRHGARFPERDRHGDERADDGGGRPPARQPRRLHRRRLQRHRPVPSVPRRRERRRSSASRRRAMGSTCRTATPPRWPAGAPACCTATAPTS